MSTVACDPQIRELWKRGRIDREIAVALGLSPDQVRRARRRLGLAVNDPVRGAVDDPDTREVAGEILPRVVALDELVAQAQVDLDVWEVYSFLVNKWEVGRSSPIDSSILTAPLWQVKAWFRRKKVDPVVTLFADVVADVERAAATRRGRRSTPAPRSLSTEAHMLEVCLFDLHLGKLAWDEETGANYDSKIAIDGARYALDDLLDQVGRQRIERVVFPLGNDFFHVDNREGTTSAGTVVDRDSRYHKMFRLGRELASEMIDRLLSIAPVHVVGVPGNHGRLAEWHLVELLAAEFRSEPRFTVDNSPRLRKYVPYGVNLIGYTHGDNEPLEKLPMVMPVEVPAEWAASRYREWHLGHVHKSKRMDAVAVDSHNGVRVRVIPSLSATDAWHYARGYVGEPRVAEAFIWSKTRGIRANLFSVLPLEDAPAPPAVLARAHAA